MTELRYVSCVDTAKLIRKALKKAFPGVKFGVRSDQYAGGCSIHVSYTDDGKGPTQKAVEAVVEPYAGGRFDGMIDLAYGVKSWLEPDGTAGIAHSPGTTGSHPSEVGAPISEEAELVHFMADYVFVNRVTTERYREELKKVVEEITGEPFAGNKVYEFTWRGRHFEETGAVLIHQMSCTDEPEGADAA